LAKTLPHTPPGKLHSPNQLADWALLCSEGNEGEKVLRKKKETENGKEYKGKL